MREVAGARVIGFSWLVVAVVVGIVAALCWLDARWTEQDDPITREARRAFERHRAEAQLRGRHG